MSKLGEKFNLYTEIVEYHEILNEVLTMSFRHQSLPSNFVARAFTVLHRHAELPMKQR